MFTRCSVPFVGVLVLISLVGCSSYTTPGGPAALGVLAASRDANTDPQLRDHFNAKPLAEFPAMVAIARVQSNQYNSRTASTFGHGRFSVVTTRDVESDSSIERLGKLQQIRGMATLNRILLPENLESERDLRRGAARVQADILLIYTFDTQFYVKDFAGPVTVFTLGLSPNRKAYVTTTASAVLLDTRSGYVYGGAEATSRSSQLANGWTSQDAVDDTRLRTEKEAFEDLVASLEHEWPNVVAQHSQPAK